MAENSRFWSTSATPTGDQQTSYSQADFADVWRAMGEGVISGHPLLNELACSAGGANTVNVATGTAIVDGIYYENTAVQNVNIPSAVGSGNTRIDRLVVRVTWANYEAKVTRIAGTDAVSPTAPAITQTSETTYDIKLCQVLVDISGNVTVTDERDWFAPTAGTDLDAIYPVGAIYISVNSTSPATLFGGTWQAFGAGRVLVGINPSDTSFDTVEETGGEKTHTLTISEMPSHNHSAATSVPTQFVSGTDYTTKPLDGNTGYTGGGAAHNNLQPYIVVYMWKRTA